MFISAGTGDGTVADGLWLQSSAERKRDTEQSVTPQEIAWDLSTIYPDEEAFEAEFSQAETQIKSMTALRGKLNTVDRVISYYTGYDEMNRLTGRLDAYKATVSVQMEDSAIRTAEIPIGETFSWSCDNSYALYLDKEGKTPIPEEAGPVQSALILYCLPKK